MRWLPSLSLLTIAGCQFERPPDVGPPSDAAIDAPTDATQVCTPGTRSCTAGRYTECDADGQHVTHLIPNGALDGSPTTIVMDDYACPMGCHATQPQCADIDASNGFNAALDDPATSATGLDLVLPQDAAAPMNLIVIDTDNYDASAGTTAITDADGVPLRVPAHVVSQADAGAIFVLQVRTLTIRAGYRVEVRGTRALGIASHFDIVVGGTLDLSAEGSDGPRPGLGQSTNADCFPQSPVGIWGGGGNAAVGGFSSNGAAGGGAQPLLTPLQGGCPGSAPGVLLGLGGGAVQLVSRTRILIGTLALVDVSGGGGRAIDFGGVLVSGGGAGGTVMFEAPTVSVAQGAVVAGRGGSGAAVGIPPIAAAGFEGPTTGSEGARSATCSGCGTSGRGGTEDRTVGNAMASSAPISAGGGGSVGVCGVRNATGAFAAPSGVMKILAIPAGRLSARSP